MWRFGAALSEDGWHATAVDLRGHGRAPRALEYTIASYAGDLRATRADGGSWDLVLGHSLGGAAAAIAAAADPSWARRLVLADPAIVLSDRARRGVGRAQAAAFADPSLASVRAQHPHWHETDLELKTEAARLTSPWAVEQTLAQNDPWDVTEAVLALSVPVHVLAADPDVDSVITGELAARMLNGNERISMSVVAGAGHSIHRDRPEETMRMLRQVVG
jgi:pimeloyl-ACP methyl ester carboxylesterase